MNSFLKHPATIALIPTVLLSVTGYFTFVQDSATHHVQTSTLIKTLQEDSDKLQVDLTTLQAQVSTYASLPPRVTELEEVSKDLQQEIKKVLINQASQGEALRNIHEDTSEVKFLLRNLDKS